MIRKVLFLIPFSILTAIGANAQNIAQGLIAYLPIDGPVVLDEGPSMSLLETADLTLGNDRRNLTNAALYFNGTSSFLRILNAELDVNQAPYAVAFWIKAEKQQPTQTLFHVGQGNPPAANTWLKINAANTGQPMTYQSTQDDQTSFVHDRAGLLFDGQWHHVVAQRTPSEMQLYIDCTLAGTDSRTQIPVLSNGSFTFGALAGFTTPETFSEFFEGALDEIRVYDRPLTRLEIAQLSETIPVPRINIGEDTTLCLSDELTLVVPAYKGYEIRWQDGSLGTSFAVSGAGTYSVEVSNACFSAGDEIKVTSIDCTCPLKNKEAERIPNAFTPNGDELNSNFKVLTYCQDILAFNMKIYNRWGQLVFETGDYRTGWDGTFKDEPAPSDTYTWVIDFTYREEGINNGQPVSEVVSGDVTLIR